MLLFEGLFTLLFGREEKIIKTKNFTAPKTMLCHSLLSFFPNQTMKEKPFFSLTSKPTLKVLELQSPLTPVLGWITDYNPVSKRKKEKEKEKRIPYLWEKGRISTLQLTLSAIQTTPSSDFTPLSDSESNCKSPLNPLDQSLTQIHTKLSFTQIFY